MCDCEGCKALRHVVYPVAPSTECNPWAMEPGDCQRALAEAYEAMKREQRKGRT